MPLERLIADALQLPADAISYDVSRELAAAFPQRAIIQGRESLFNVEEYAHAGECSLTLGAHIHNQLLTRWRRPRQDMGMWTPYDPQASSVTWSDRGIREQVRNAWFEVRWRDHALSVIAMRWAEAHYLIYHHWIIAESKEIAQEFYAAVCAWNSEIRGEVLVFKDGCWQKDEELYRDIKGATFDNLVLAGDLAATIRGDLAQFFAARSLYERHGIPWKRGVLFVGPPGNGKTHAVKALLNELGKPCLYATSFRTQQRTEESCIAQVFEQARHSAPCVLVLEDLDSLVTPQNRSFFLNELDGFAANIGILTLATTNHPERLDPAILDRPSRFDRKYPFDLPATNERRAYIALWNAQLQPALRLSDSAMEAAIAGTEGFSYAYLKELFLSAMMRWIADPREGAMNDLIPEQAVTLREQMASILPEPPAPPSPPQIPSVIVSGN